MGQPIPEPDIADGEVLIPVGSEWLVWASETEGPPAWPLPIMPEVPRTLEEVLPADTPVTTDRFVDMTADYVQGWDWTPVMTPTMARSHATHDSLADTWATEARRRARRGRPDPTRTTFLYSSGDLGATTGGVRGETEPGLTNLYFTRTIDIADPDAIRSLQFNMEFSGGVIVYVNGTQVLRHHIRPGHEAHNNHGTPYWLPDHVNQRSRYRWEMTWMDIDPGLLVEGENVISVAVYKLPTGGRRAMYFDMEAIAYPEVGLTRTPYLQSMQQDSMTVMWESNVPAYGYVEYGPEGSEALTRVATSAAIAGIHQEVVLRDLEPDTRYFYRVITVPVPWEVGRPAEPPIEEDIRHFRTAVPRGTPFSFVAYGDTRTQEDIHTALNQQLWEDAVTRDARMIVHTGDITTWGASWQEWQIEFFEPALPLIGHIPFYSSLGNHEGNHEKYYTYMSLPNNEAWYTFSMGDADFFALNTSFDFSPGSEQHEWLREALAASDAAWKIPFFHHPPYACTPSRKPGNENVIEYLVPVFEEFQVPLVLLGHDHLYGRSADLNGVRYVITGGGGAPSYPAEPDAINEVCYREFHYCMIDVSADRLVLEAIALGGAVLDTLVLEQPPVPAE